MYVVKAGSSVYCSLDPRAPVTGLPRASQALCEAPPERQARDHRGQHLRHQRGHKHHTVSVRVERWKSSGGSDGPLCVPLP